MNIIKKIALFLIIIGAINWGLIGILNFDLVATLFWGQDSLVSRVIYSLVGLSGLYAITFFLDDRSVNSKEDGIRTNVPRYETEFSSELDSKNNNNFNNKKDD